MFVQELYVRNFCQHQEQRLVFQSGLTAIMGPNGSGKSNLLGALRLALTGDNPNAGNKADNICQIAPATEPAYVSLTFHHGDARAVVVRHLRPNVKSTLAIEGLPTVHGDQAVNARLQELLGLDAELLNTVVLVSQGDIFGFLAKTPAKRAEALQRLFRTEAAERIYTALGQYLTTLAVPHPTIDCETVERQVAEGRQQLVEAERRLQQCRPVDVLHAEHAAAVRCCELWRHRQTLLAQQAACQQSLADVREDLRQELETISRTEAALATVVQRREALEQAAQEARQVLTLAAQTEALWQRRDELLARKQLREQELATWPPPEKPEDYIVADAAVLEAMTALSQEIFSDEKFLASLGPDSGVTVCPVCRTPVTTLQDRYAQVQRELPEKRERYRRLSRQYQASVAYDQAVEKYNARRQKLQEQIAGIEADLESLGALLPETLPDKAQAAECLKAYEGYREQETAFRTVLGELRQKLARLQAREEALHQQMRGYEEQLRGISVTAEQAQQAETRAQSLAAEVQTTLAAANAVTAIRTRLEAWEEQLRQAKQARRQAAATRGLMAHLTEIRSLFHKDGAPRFVAQASLQRLCGRTNEYLQALGADFWVAADEGLSFQAHFPDGRIQPAERLSGGQKVVLALAFRLAVYFVYAGDVAFLALDEPTVYLDADAVVALKTTLDQLRSVVAARGMQMVLVTHETSLAPSFDRVITLGG